MDAVDCIKTRRSIRKYADKEVPDEILKELIDCARRAPASHGAQSWEFVLVRDKSTKEKLSKIHKWCGFVKGAAAVIVVCYDKMKLKFSPSDIINPSLAAQNILLAAHSLGLGACWVFVKDFDDPDVEQKAKGLLGIPESAGVLCMIPVGYPDEKPAHKKLREIDDVLHMEKWQ
ncbi:MAG: nitroreductase family protein [Candidatus Aenigmatarchaeota archaeon]